MDIKKASEVGSSLVTATVSALSKEPFIAVFAAGVQPFVKEGFEKALNNIFGKNVTQGECRKLGISYQAAIDKINKNIEDGLSVRNDAFFESDKMGYSEADDILEGILKNAMNDMEQRNAKLYGHFLANIAFYPEIDVSTMVAMQKIITQLTYYHICCVRYLAQNAPFNAEKWNVASTEDTTLKKTQLWLALKAIDRLGLASRVPPYNLGDEIGNIKLSVLGEALYKLMDLESIDSADLVDIEHIE